MILLAYCIILTAYQGDPSTFLYVMSMGEWLVEVWMAIRMTMERAK